MPCRVMEKGIFLNSQLPSLRGQSPNDRIWNLSTQPNIDPKCILTDPHIVLIEVQSLCDKILLICTLY